MTLVLEHGLIVSLVRGEVPKVHAPFHVYHLWAGRLQKWTLRMQLSRCCVYMHYQRVNAMFGFNSELQQHQQREGTGSISHRW